jgi:hypothetical protein
MITNTEFNVLKAIASDDGDWNFANLDRLLSRRNKPSLRYVVRMVGHLANEGLVDIVVSQHSPMLSCRISKKGLEVLRGAEC